MRVRKNHSLAELAAPVFNLLKQIPKGRIVTYGFLARHCGVPNARLVGWILKQNTEPEKIPCFRVVRADGRLADGYKFGGRIGQSRRLSADGVEIIDGVRLKNFKVVLWQGRD
jgi:methylated-DNA-protein-cysteine methyltransferase-like protein